MGIWRIFKPTRSARLGFVALLAFAVVAAGVTLALAAPGGGVPARQTHQTAPGARPSADKILRALANPSLLHDVLAGRSIFGARATTSPGAAGTIAGRGSGHKRRRTLATRVFIAAADWPYAYAVVTKTKISLDMPMADLDALGRESLTLTRRNIVTGETVPLLTFRQEFPLAMKAAGGRVMLTLIKPSGRHVTSRTMAFDSGTTTPATLARDVASFPGSDRQTIYCGGLSVLTGADADGEALITRLTIACDTSGANDYDMQTLAFARDGSTRVLDEHPSFPLLLIGNTELSSGKLLESGPLVNTIAEADPATGARKLLWSGENVSSATQAGDGSVAIGPVEPPSDGMTSAARHDVANPAPSLVMFPQGDADHPRTSDGLSQNTLLMHYCGSTLYQLDRAKSKRAEPRVPPLGLFGDGLIAARTLRVIARDVNGDAPRVLKQTAPIWVRSIGCDGETLLLTTARGATVHVSRIGP